jgi:hypothetical protein
VLNLPQAPRSPRPRGATLRRNATSADGVVGDRRSHLR